MITFTINGYHLIDNNNGVSKSPLNFKPNQKKMEKLTISYRLKSTEEDPYGTWYFYKEYNRVVLKLARKEAERLSLKGYDQVEIMLRTEDDPKIQEYWQNGKLIFKMF